MAHRATTKQILFCGFSAIIKWPFQADIFPFSTCFLQAVQQLMDNETQQYTLEGVSLTQEDHDNLSRQNSRLVSVFQANLLEQNAAKHWDKFYMRNETRFFKDRHWTLREFEELLEGTRAQILLEVGCGVGNLLFPLLEKRPNLRIFACDLSPRAVKIVQDNDKYDSNRITAFVCDITSNSIFDVIPENSVDVITLVFVLSAISPDKFDGVFDVLWRLLKPGGLILFRDYGLHDMVQLRFKPGHKIAENFYMRQDGTRSYFFSVEELNGILERARFEVVESLYVHRRTVNRKENLDVGRVFLQAKAKKKI